MVTIEETRQVIKDRFPELQKAACKKLMIGHLSHLAPIRNKSPDMYGLQQKEDEPFEHYVTRFAKECRCSLCVWFLWLGEQLVPYKE